MARKKRHLSLSYKPPEGDLAGDLEPVSFDLRDEEFTCVDEIPAAVILKIGVAQDPDAENWEQLRAVQQFFQTVVIPADRARFDKVLNEASPVIGIEELIEHMNDLAEAMTDRPTEPQQDSPTSAPSKAATLTEDSSAVVSEEVSTI